VLNSILHHYLIKWKCFVKYRPFDPVSLHFLCCIRIILFGCQTSQTVVLLHVKNTHIHIGILFVLLLLLAVLSTCVCSLLFMYGINLLTPLSWSLLKPQTDGPTRIVGHQPFVEHFN